MKKLLVILAIAGFIFTSCANEKKKESTDLHTHEDGTTHRNEEHNHDNTAMPDQESFEVEADTTISDTVKEVHAHDHDHENGHEHQH